MLVICRIIKLLLDKTIGEDPCEEMMHSPGRRLGTNGQIRDHAETLLP